MEIRAFQPADADSVIELWNRCGLLRPWNDPHQEIARKRLVQSEWFLVGVIDGQIIATVMAGFDGHRGWINYLAVDPSHQRNGYGSALIVQVERLLSAFGCPKVNLQIRSDNLDAIKFYERIGFSPDAVVSFGKRLIPDDSSY